MILKVSTHYCDLTMRNRVKVSINHEQEIAYVLSVRLYSAGNSRQHSVGDSTAGTSQEEFVSRLPNSAQPSTTSLSCRWILPFTRSVMKAGPTITCSITAFYYARKQLLLSYRNSVTFCSSVSQSVCPSHGGSVKNDAIKAKITKSSPSAIWRTLVSGSVKLFHKFEGDHTERQR